MKRIFAAVLLVSFSALAADLEEKTDALGFSIKLPKGATEADRSKMNAAYSVKVKKGELTANVTKGGAASLAEAANIGSASGEVTEKKEVPGGFLITVKPFAGTSAQVFFISAKFTAKCMAPAEEKALLTMVCTSVVAK